ncbi:MAG TPA: tetratricopeptide repeat protein, partial [Balneolales bacterium]|nr:tetratricopeptide repeat protein [Balneolales bacterium]
MNLRDFFYELKRRNVFKVTGVYAVAGWLLIQIAATTFPFLNIPDWAVRLVIALVLIGFPIALIIAWAFELTPEGVKRTEEVTAEKSVTKKTGHKLNVILGVILVFTVGIIFYQQFFKTQPAVSGAVTKGRAIVDSSSAPAKSIAVLPFENLSEDKKNGYFADGMQDMILTKLADIGDLKVISRTSTLQFGSHPQNLKKIGRELGVAMLLEGSVQKAGDQVLINVQLIDARSDHHIWAQSYQRTLENIFGVEGEVAGKVAVALKAKLDPAEQVLMATIPTHNPAAYDAYLRGVSLETNATDITGINLEKVASHYEQAVKLDPDFALAWAHLSSVDSNISFSEISSSRLARAKTALERAVTLAPDAAATEIAKGDYAYYGHFEYAKALAAYRKALQISPNSTTALVNIGFVLRRQGHWQQAIDYMNRSLVLDPRNISTLSNLVLSNESLQRYEKAEVLLRRALAISPGDPIMITQLADFYQITGNLAKADKVLAGARISPIYWERSYPTVIKQALLTHHYEEAIHLAKVALA